MESPTDQSIPTAPDGSTPAFPPGTRVWVCDDKPWLATVEHASWEAHSMSANGVLPGVYDWTYWVPHPNPPEPCNYGRIGYPEKALASVSAVDLLAELVAPRRLGVRGREEVDRGDVPAHERL